MIEEKMPYVVMSAKLTIKTDRPVDFEHEVPVYIGGFSAIVDDNEILFDFDAFSGAAKCVEENTYEFSYRSGYGMLFDEFHISEDYEDMISDAGMSIYDLTAKKLAAMTELTEFYLEPDTDTTFRVLQVKILEIHFEDQEKSYDVSEDVLSKTSEMLTESFNDWSEYDE